MNTISTLATLVTGFKLLATEIPATAVAVENAAAPTSSFSPHFAIAFGVCVTMLSIFFGTMAFSEIENVRRLKKRNADIEERYRQVRSDLLREMDRRHQAEQTIRAVIAPPVTTTTTATAPLSVAYTISSSLPPGASSSIFPVQTSDLGNITLRVAPPAATPVAEPPDQNHFARIAVPRRFLRLD